VIVVHEIFGLTDWIRGVADQLAAEGFIAVAPDLLSGKGPGGGGTETLDQQTAIRLIREIARPELERRLQAAARYGRSLPAARDAVTSIGFCWGGSVSFRMAAFMPGLRGAVVYYGGSPDSTTLGQIAAPVLGLYAGDDARVNATIEPAQRELRRLGRRYEIETYDGAGHGFLRAQPERDGANLRASQGAWPRMLAFLREVTRG
jgi:carboxymethylenebutenolidase